VKGGKRFSEQIDNRSIYTHIWQSRLQTRINQKR
jgi:hypothetical protein